MQYQKSQKPIPGDKSVSEHPNGQNRPGNRFAGEGRQPIAGEVISISKDSITVKDQEGGSKIVFILDETNFRKSEEGSLEDLSEGTQVMIIGSENSDGIVTANSIQLNPGFPFNGHQGGEQGE